MYRNESVIIVQALTRIGNLSLIAIFLIVTLLVSGPYAFAADTPSPRTEQQIETTILHVDQYAVYGPNIIFYWDPGMNKQKVSALTGLAEKLRNKSAVITYSTSSDLTKDKRLLLVDIAGIKREVPPSGDSVPQKEPSRPSLADSEENPPPSPSPLSPVKDETKPESEEAAPPKPSVQPEPKPSAARPVSAGSSTLTRTEVVNFVYDCIDAAQTKDIERSLACYAEQVDYYSKGTVNKDFIRKDKGYYFRNWDSINSTIDGEIVLIVIDQPDLKIAKFNSRFYVENAKNRVSGRAENIWKIQKVGNELKIVDEKQKIIERD